MKLHQCERPLVNHIGGIQPDKLCDNEWCQRLAADKWRPIHQQRMFQPDTYSPLSGDGETLPETLTADNVRSLLEARNEAERYERNETVWTASMSQDLATLLTELPDELVAWIAAAAGGSTEQLANLWLTCDQAWWLLDPGEVQADNGGLGELFDRLRFNRVDGLLGYVCGCARSGECEQGSPADRRRFADKDCPNAVFDPTAELRFDADEFCFYPQLEVAEALRKTYKHLEIPDTAAERRVADQAEWDDYWDRSFKVSKAFTDITEALAPPHDKPSNDLFVSNAPF